MLSAQASRGGRRRRGPPPPPPDPRTSTFFQLFGYAKTRLFDAQAMQRLSREFDRLCGDWPDERPPSSRVNQSPVVRELVFNNPAVWAFLDQCFGSRDYVAVQGEMFAMTRTSSWHRDFGARVLHVKLNVYLEDCSRGGGLCFLPGTQFVDDRYGALVGKELNWPENEGLAVPDVPLVDSRPALGEAVAFSTSLVHAATPNNVRRRRCYSFLFVAVPEDGGDEAVRQYLSLYRLHDCLTGVPVPPERQDQLPLVRWPDEDWVPPDEQRAERWDAYLAEREAAGEDAEQRKYMKRPVGGPVTVRDL